jgi:hypothetical protein
MSKLFVDEIVHQSSQGSGTITIGASGETINVVGTLQNNGAGVGGVNTPAFEAYLSSDQNINQSTNTKIQFNTEVFDTANAYDNSTNYRFTPQVAGKYFVYASVNCGSATNTDNNKMDIANIFFKKNGSDTGHSQRFSTYTQKIMERMVSCPSGIITLNGSTDYVEVYAYISSNTQATLFTSTGIRSYFGAYKIIE